MYFIAICDNEENDLQDIREKVKKWLDLHKEIEGDVACFVDPKALLREIEEGKVFDLYLLDIIMPEMNGIDLGRAIRRQDDEVPVIFTTAAVEYALDAYGLHAVRYLTKPVQEAELFSALDFVQVLFQNRSGDRLMVKGNKVVTSIQTDEILYVENDVRTMTYVLRGGRSITGVRRNLSFEKALEPLAAHPSFIQTHKSFFVNMKYIDSLHTGYVRMEDGSEIPISRKRIADVRREYVDFITRSRLG